MSDKNIKFEEYLANLFKARFPFTYIQTWEEDRIVEIVQNIAKDKKLIKNLRKVYIWSLTEGMRDIYKANNPIDNASEPLDALNFIKNSNEHAIFILKDFHVYFGSGGKNADQEILRKIRDTAYTLKDSDNSKNVVIVAPVLELPAEIQKDITVVDFELPDIEDIKNSLNAMIESNEGSRVKIKLEENEKEILCKAALGLTVQEAENAFARAMVERGKLTISELDIIMDEKCQAIKKSGILEFIKSDMNMNDVGGLENLKKWLSKRNNSWLDKAAAYNLPAPKGVLITGVPGCGKSLTAKAISEMWKLPLLRLDVGRIFSGLVGSSEENMRKAIVTAQAVAPSILWIDEIEKGFSGLGGSGDSGTSSRVFGTFLTWMQEKTQPVFVIATSNNIDILPSELLRKGRFDEIFFVDLPTKNERKAIFELHLKKRLKNSVSSDFKATESLLNRLIDETEGFVGAEIEQVIMNALFEAFSEDRILEEKDLINAVKNTVPLSVTQAEQIFKIRKWADVRAVAATSKEDRSSYTEEAPVEIKTEDETVKKSRGGRAIDF